MIDDDADEEEVPADSLALDDYALGAITRFATIVRGQLEGMSPLELMNGVVGVGGDTESRTAFEAGTEGFAGDPAEWLDEVEALSERALVSFDGWEPDDELPWGED